MAREMYTVIVNNGVFLMILFQWQFPKVSSSIAGPWELTPCLFGILPRKLFCRTKKKEKILDLVNMC